MDPITLIVTIVVVFLLNSLLEEVFYRRWLQTRWELTLGRWPAIVLASLLWAAWHVAIQDTGGGLDVDLASVLVGAATESTTPNGALRGADQPARRERSVTRSDGYPPRSRGTGRG